MGYKLKIKKVEKFNHFPSPATTENTNDIPVF